LSGDDLDIVTLGGGGSVRLVIVNAHQTKSRTVRTPIVACPEPDASIIVRLLFMIAADSVAPGFRAGRVEKP
jgi:hypothetical protein